MGSTNMFIQATKGEDKRIRKKRITGVKAYMRRLGMAMAETARRWVKNSFSDFTIEFRMLDDLVLLANLLRWETAGTRAAEALWRRGGEAKSL